jgi:hypothetical protein
MLEAMSFLLDRHGRGSVARPVWGRSIPPALREPCKRLWGCGYATPHRVDGSGDWLWRLTRKGLADPLWCRFVEGERRQAAASAYMQELDEAGL